MAMSKTCLVTGSSGLIGSEVAAFFHERGFAVHGVDNNQREAFFGPQGNTRWNQERLTAPCRASRITRLDIRDRAGVLQLIETLKPAVIIHTAAQPSHDLAARIPFDDFDVNAVGTLEPARGRAPLLSRSRRSFTCPPTRCTATGRTPSRSANWRRAGTTPIPQFAHGIPENFSIDQSKHSLFGASKVAADVMVQEYGRYFDLPTCCLRGGCLTGPNHSGVELHGFLSYLVKCNLEGREYKIYGYKGKQVRDNIHSAGRRAASCSSSSRRRAAARSIISAAARKTPARSSKHSRWPAPAPAKSRCHTYVDQARSGDHICYYSDLRKMKLTQAARQLIRTRFEEIVAHGRSGSPARFHC